MSARTIKKDRQPPGPRGVRFASLIPFIPRDRLAFMLNTAIMYGGVARYMIVNATVYQINDPDAIQHVLQENNKNYHKGFQFFPTFQMTLGRGLLTNEDEPWLKQRRLMAPIFHRRNIEAMGELMVRRTLALAESWQPRAASGETVNIAAEMMQLTLGIVSDALLSADITGRARAVGAAVTTMVEDTTLRFDNPFYPPPSVPTPHNRAFRRGLQEVDSIIYGLIRDRRAHPNGHQDLLQLLLDASDPESGEGMSEKQVRDELVTLFLAGHETTANLLAWTFYLLSLHPEIETRLHAEVNAVLNGRDPTVGDLPNLPFTRRVLDETLRLYPPAWVVNRTALAEDELCGYSIPAGAFLIMSPYVMHHHPRYWDEPEKFDPDRFLPERSGDRHRFVYFPFGGGPRLCIGRDFALVEAHLILAALAQRFQLQLVPGARVMPQPLVTLRPRGGLPMKIIAR